MVSKAGTKGRGEESIEPLTLDRSVRVCSCGGEVLERALRVGLHCRTALLPVSGAHLAMLIL